MDTRQLAVLLVVTLALSPVVGTAAAAGANNSTAGNATTSPNVVKRIDAHGYVSAVRWSNGVMHLTIHSDTYRTATVSGTVGGDSGRFAIHDVTLYRGTTNVSVGAPKVSGAATATIVTRSCKKSGSCPFVQVGNRAGSPFSGGSTFGWVAGAFVSVLTFFVVGWLVLRRGNGTPEEA